MASLNNSTLYTRAGDSGQTRIGGSGAGRRVPKTNGTIEVLGNIDELMSFLGLAKAGLPSTETILAGQLSDLQQKLILLKEDLSSYGGVHKISQADVEWLEKQIDEYAPCAQMKDPALIPGSCESSAQLDIARSVARRVERTVSKAGLPNTAQLKFVNRMSDFIYAAARYMDFRRSIEKKLLGEVPQSLQTPEVPTPVTSKPLPLSVAKRLLDELEAEANQKGIPFVLAVADESGRPIAVHVMDDALIASYDIAVNKAFTAASLKMPTKDLAELCAPGGSLYGLQHTNDGKIVIFGGGIPLTNEAGRIVGALGVSGSTAEIDTEMSEIGEQIYSRIR